MSKQDAEYDAVYATRSKAEAAADHDPAIPFHLQHNRKASEWALFGTVVVLGLLWYVLSNLSTCAVCVK